jgi:hypothetical protein
LAIDHLPSDEITDRRFYKEPLWAIQARRFHKERLGAIDAGSLPAPVILDDKPGTIVSHIVPLSAFALIRPWVGADFLAAGWDKLRLYGRQRDRDYRVNIDGLLVWSSGQEHAAAYVQVHRTGIVEAVGRGVVHTNNGPQPTIDSARVEIGMVALVLSNLRYLKGFGFVPPFAIVTTLIGATGVRVDEGDHGGNPPLTIDRSPLRFTEVIVETIPVDEQDTARALRPLFDELANAGGWLMSQNFEKDGSWKLRAMVDPS